MTAMLAIGALSALIPASAAAQIFELGVPRSPLVAPVCPPTVTASNCTIILARATGLETVRDGVAYPTTVTKAGKIVAFTLGLSRLDNNLAKAKQDVHFLDTTFGGTAQAGITILKRVGKKSAFRWSVVAQSPIYHLQPYLGTVVQFPLDTSIAVTPGEVVALTALGLRGSGHGRTRNDGLSNGSSGTSVSDIPRVAPHVVAGTIEAERRRLEPSRVRDFLPLVVERAARTRLKQRAVAQPTPGDLRVKPAGLHASRRATPAGHPGPKGRRSIPDIPLSGRFPCACPNALWTRRPVCMRARPVAAGP